MPIASNSLPRVPTSWNEPALPAFSALCDEALHRCSAHHGLPVTPSAEMRLRAWQLCWLALDAASAPANNLPDIADAQAWPPELVAQLNAAAALPKLKSQAWQELRRARDQQLFATLPPQQPVAAESIANEALAALLTQAFARLDLQQLRAWITPSVTAVIARWLSACFLAIDSLALSDDDTDARALELIMFVHATLQRVHGPVATVDDAVQSEVEQSAAVSGQAVFEAKIAAEPAAPLDPQPVVAPAVSPAAPQPVASDVAVGPSVPKPADVIEQPPSTSTGDVTRVSTPQASIRPRRSRPRAIAQIASVVAVGAVLLFMLTSGNVAPPPDATHPTLEAKPPVTTPEPSARVATPEPPIVQPVPSSKPPRGAATQRPRFRNLAAAKRAHAAKKLDDVAYAAAIAEIEALRTEKIAKEQLELSRGKLSQHDYQRRVDAINRSLGSAPGAMSTRSPVR